MSLFGRSKAVWVLAFVIITTITLAVPQLNIAAPTPAQAQGGSGPDYVSAPVTPTLSAAASTLPAPVVNGPVREIPRLVTHQGRAATTAVGGLDALLDPNQVLPILKAFATADRNLDGIPFQSVNPSDPNGDVGPNHFIEVSNSTAGTLVWIYNKATPPVVQTTFNLDSLNPGAPCNSGNGDPIVLWDSLADRWLLAEFASSGNNMCIYVSQTADPTGAYWAYTFSTPSFPDYFKFGVWPDAYYMTSNENNPTAYAFDRANMLTGGAATFQRFTVTALDGFGFQALTPVDLDGTTAPAAGSTEGIFMRHVDTAAHPTYSGGGQDFLEMYFFDVDFAVPANSTLTGPTTINVTDFDSDLCGLSSFNCFPQSGTGTTLDPLREVIMWRLSYRNFGAYESIVGNFVTDTTATDVGGVRWFELRRAGGAWTLTQEGTYAGPGAPDGISRWMGAIAQDGDGNLALGYSASNGSMFPSLWYTGRLATDPAGTMPRGENVLVNGGGFNGSNRWGDYFSMSIDPSDDCTFWFVGMYPTAGNVWQTRIGSFAFDSCLNPALLSDMAVTKTDGLTTANPGDASTYTIVVTNNGPSRTTDATVVDTFPAEFTNPTWTCAVTGTGSCTDAGPTAGNINTTVTLDTGSFATFTVNGTIDAGTPGPYTLSNSVTVDAGPGETDPNAGDNVATDDTDIVAALLPDLEILITADDTTVDVGQLVTFTVAVRNIGTDDIVQGSIDNDTLLPVGLTYTGDTCGAALALPLLTWSIAPPMVAGDPAVTCTISATVDAGTEGQTLSTFASTTFGGAELDLVNNDAVEDIRVNDPGVPPGDDDDGGTTPTGGGDGGTVTTTGETSAPTSLPPTGYAPSDNNDNSTTTILLIVAAGALALSLLATSLMLWRKQD